jgi:hypothetical protein
VVINVKKGFAAQSKSIQLTMADRVGYFCCIPEVRASEVIIPMLTLDGA